MEKGKEKRWRGRKGRRRFEEDLKERRAGWKGVRGLTEGCGDCFSYLFILQSKLLGKKNKLTESSWLNIE